MKKLFALSLFLVLSNVIYAQSIRFGLTGSPQLNWLRSDDTALKSDGVRLGFNYGLLAEFYFHENYGIATGFLLEHTGGRAIQSILQPLPVVANQVYKLQYINIPVSLKLKTNEIGYMTYYGQFGLTPAFRVRARLDSEVGSLRLENQDIRSDIKWYNLSLTVGGGVEYSLSESVSLLLGLYYNNGFVSVVRDTDQKVTLNSVGLRTGVLF